ncbi:hypothetical protein GCM10008025_35990 [Ornithinibacillus halotolerans]|uniref:Uncharacterized protein n=1 Tax=Ornithinibacillus halotolerans TaxID=1274357 RepID=A0A916S9I4_9BACI|nr:hypothetical protein GCM10008025_35990 [Ornithinibacillus halotolerans]
MFKKIIKQLKYMAGSSSRRHRHYYKGSSSRRFGRYYGGSSSRGHKHNPFSGSKRYKRRRWFS